MNITIIGTGYVGLVSGVCFADLGVNTICVDNNKDKIDILNNGGLTIYEPNLDKLIIEAKAKNKITFTTNLKESILKSNIIIFALPTPENEDGSANLEYIIEISNEISTYINDYKVIVNKSTVPVGTSKIVKDIFEKKSSIKVDVVSNPEFLREGFAIEDFQKPDRIVIGSSSIRAIEVMKKLYLPITKLGYPLIVMDEKSAELTKYAANTFLALKISFMNEMANLTKLTGGNIDNIKEGIGSDKRIGDKFLNAGIGFGGGCFPKDVKALNNTAKSNGYKFKIIDSLIEVNDAQKNIFLNTIKSKLPKNISKIAFWGLSFKPNTDDIRESPAIFFINNLIDDISNISVFDPQAMENVKKIYKDKINYGQDLYEILDDSEALVISTEWDCFKTADLDLMYLKMKNKLIFDGRNIFDLEKVKKFEYHSIGR